MKIHTIHPHQLSDGKMAFTVQIDDGGEIKPFVYELDLAEAAWIANLLTKMVYDKVSK